MSTIDEPSTSSVDPTQVGRVPRALLGRTATASCLDCRAGWAHAWALAAGADHARAHGHRVEGHYSVSYLYGGSPAGAS